MEDVFSALGELGDVGDWSACQNQWDVNSGEQKTERKEWVTEAETRAI